MVLVSAFSGASVDDAKVRTGNRGSRKLLLPNSDREVASVELRFAFGDGVFGEKTEDFVQEFLTDFFVRHFAATEDNHDFDMVAIFEETFDFTDFDVKVVVANFETNFHLLELGLFFASFFAIFRLFFHLLVLEFAPIDDFNDRRVGVSGNLNEVDASVTGEELGLTARHNAELLSISSNYAYFGITDFSVEFGA